MSTTESLKIEDLSDSRELDQAAMRSIAGGTVRIFQFEQITGRLFSGRIGRLREQHLARRPLAHWIEHQRLDRS